MQELSHSLRHADRNSLIHSLRHADRNSFIQSVRHARVTHSLIHSGRHTGTHSLIHSGMQRETHSFIDSGRHTGTHSFLHSLRHARGSSFINSFWRAHRNSFIHSPRYAFTYNCVLSFLYQVHPPVLTLLSITGSNQSLSPAPKHRPRRTHALSTPRARASSAHGTFSPHDHVSSVASAPGRALAWGPPVRPVQTLTLGAAG